MSQRQMILNHLFFTGPLTPGNALNLYGVNRLAARIRDLREDGEKIVTRMVTGAGGRKRVAEYRLAA